MTKTKLLTILLVVMAACLTVKSEVIELYTFKDYEEIQKNMDFEIKGDSTDFIVYAWSTKYDISHDNETEGKKAISFILNDPAPSSSIITLSSNITVPSTPSFYYSLSSKIILPKNFFYQKEEL